MDETEEIKRFTRRFLDASSLLVWGSVLSYFCFSGRVEAYLHPAFHLPVLLSGIFLVAAGFAVFLFGGAAPCNCEDPLCPEGKSPALWKCGAAWCVLVLPLLWASSASPSQFGATAMLNRGVVDSLDQLPALSARLPDNPYGLLAPQAGAPWAADPSMDVSTYLAKTPEGRIAAETIDLLFAAQEPPLRPDFENREIEIIGQALPGRDPAPDGKGPAEFHLVRVFIMCCAADGRPVGVTVRGELPEGLSPSDWVRVRGTATFPERGGRAIPLVVASEIDPIPAPKNPFLY